MTQEVAIHNDYFKKHFILSFPVAGVHMVEVTTHVSDHSGTLWHTGPTNKLQIKSHDEAVQKQQQLQYAAQRAAKNSY